jgi:hypothetical protein
MQHQPSTQLLAQVSTPAFFREPYLIRAFIGKGYRCSQDPGSVPALAHSAEWLESSSPCPASSPAQLSSNPAPALMAYSSLSLIRRGSV